MVTETFRFRQQWDFLLMPGVIIEINLNDYRVVEVRPVAHEPLILSRSGVAYPELVDVVVVRAEAKAA